MTDLSKRFERKEFPWPRRGSYRTLGREVTKEEELAWKKAYNEYLRKSEEWFFDGSNVDDRAELVYGCKGIVGVLMGVVTSGFRLVDLLSLTKKQFIALMDSIGPKKAEILEAHFERFGLRFREPAPPSPTLLARISEIEGHVELLVASRRSIEAEAKQRTDPINNKLREWRDELIRLKRQIREES